MSDDPTEAPDPAAGAPAPGQPQRSDTHRPPAGAFDLRGQRVLVVGGSSGIGLAIAGLAHAHGAHVVLAARSFKRLARAAGALGGVAPGAERGPDPQGADGQHGRVEIQQLDTTREGSVEEALHSIGGVDHVVISAGQVVGGAVLDTDLGDMIASMNGKFFGALRVIKAVELRRGGSITLVSGVLSRRPQPGRVVIGAINAALEALTRGLALELAPTRVNCLAPGLTDTPAYGAMAAEERAAMFHQVAERLPAGRIGQPLDLARLALAMMATPFMTGAVVDVDGGYRLV